MILPIMAKNGINARIFGFEISSSPIIMAMTNPAPAFIPKIPESANGFFVRVCSKTPDTAKAAPPIMQAKMRGSLIFRTIKDMVAFDFPRKTLNTWLIDELAYPMASDARKMTNNRSKRGKKRFVK